MIDPEPLFRGEQGAAVRSKSAVASVGGTERIGEIFRQMRAPVMKSDWLLLALLGLALTFVVAALLVAGFMP